jgi:MFS family permease
MTASTLLRRRGLAPLLAAEVVSSLGTQMTFLALPWFVLVTTGSPARMTIVLAVQLLPVALLGIPSGTLVTRLGARRTMLLGDSVRAPLMAAIPLLHLAGVLSFGLLLVCVFLLGCFIAPYFSAQRLILPELVGDDERTVAQANAVVEGAQRTTMLLGPATAGVLISAFGATKVLYIDAATFLFAAIVLSVFVPRRPPLPATDESRGVLAGVRFLARDPFLRPLTAAQVISQAAFQALVIALPVLAFVEYGESAGIAGLLLAAWGGGALLGSALSYRTTRTWDLLRTGDAAWLAQALPLWLLVTSVPAGVAAVALLLSGLGNGFRVPAMQALALLRTPVPLRQQTGAASSSMAMLGGVLALAAAGPVLEELGTRPALAGVAALSTLAAAVGIVATGRERAGAHAAESA